MTIVRNVYWDSAVFRHPAKVGLSFLLFIYHGFRHCVTSPVAMTPSPSDEGFPIRQRKALRVDKILRRRRRIHEPVRATES